MNVVSHDDRRTQKKKKNQAMRKHMPKQFSAGAQ